VGELPDERQECERAHELVAHSAAPPEPRPIWDGGGRGVDGRRGNVARGGTGAADGGDSVVGSVAVAAASADPIGDACRGEANYPAVDANVRDAFAVDRFPERSTVFIA